MVQVGAAVAGAGRRCRARSARRACGREEKQEEGEERRREKGKENGEKEEREIKVANLLMMIHEGINQREIRLGMDFGWKRN